jgi:WD40 repeat protein
MVRSVMFSCNGKYLASGSNDKDVKLWSMESCMEIKSLIGHQSNVTSVAFSPDNEYLVSGSEDKTIKLWSVES